MTSRNFEISGSDGAAITIMASGWIADDGTVTGHVTKIDGDTLAVDTASITGTVTGSAPETLAFASIAATLNLSVTGTITEVGIITATATLDGATAIPMSGASNNRVVTFAATAQHEVEANGLTVLGGINPDDPCALAKVLRAAYLDLISGQAISRTEIAGRSVYFQRGDLSALKSEMERAEAACRAANGTTQTPTTVARSRRAIRFNPYL